MQDKWLMFPVTMGEDQAFISFNESFAERAQSDARQNHLRVEIPIKDPTEAGMPQGGEFKTLSRLDDAFESALAKLGGIYVGRVTVAGRRYFYFYLDASEADAREVVARAAGPFGYAVQLRWVHDPQKTRYWHDLYPTADDWQVIKDMQVLDALAEAGDNPDTHRIVEHWAYFNDESSSAAFRAWLPTQGFTFKDAHTGEDGRLCIMFTRDGPMHLADVSSCSIRCRRKADELGGEYDGWETSVEKGR